MVPRRARMERSAIRITPPAAPAPPERQSTLACAGSRLHKDNLSVIDRSVFQRLDPDECGSVIVAYPQLGGIYRLVHIHSANVGLGREEIIDDLSGLGIESRNMIVAHPTRPGIGAVVENRVIGHREGRGQLPLLESLSLRIEHPDSVTAIFRKP